MSSLLAWKKSSARFWFPTEEVVEMRNGQKRKSERKFFPGYVLVQMENERRYLAPGEGYPRVMGFIGGTAD